MVKYHSFSHFYSITSLLFIYHQYALLRLLFTTRPFANRVPTVSFKFPSRPLPRSSPHPTGVRSENITTSPPILFPKNIVYTLPRSHEMFVSPLSYWLVARATTSGGVATVAASGAGADGGEYRAETVLLAIIQPKVNVAALAWKVTSHSFVFSLHSPRVLCLSDVFHFDFDRRT